MTEGPRLGVDDVVVVASTGLVEVLAGELLEVVEESSSHCIE